jgi:hypothetical protein
MRRFGPTNEELKEVGESKIMRAFTIFALE